MALKFKILRIDTTQHSIVVRYYTDIVGEDHFAARDQNGNPLLDQSGEILSCRTDFNVDLPVPPPTGDELTAYITARAPQDWLQLQEIVVTKSRDTSLSSVEPLLKGEVSFAASSNYYAQDLTEYDRKWTAIKAERDRRKEGGVKVGDHWFHTDVFSRTQQMGLKMLGDAVPPVAWKTMDGTFVTMTPALAEQVFQAVAASDMALFAIAEAKRAEMAALADPSVFSVSAGWPQGRS